MTREKPTTNKQHHRKSIRLKGYDYQNGGMYFVTICTKNKECIFGDIGNGIVGLSEVGCVVAEEIQKTPHIRPYVTIDTWCVMPNHVHILLWMDDIRYRHGVHAINNNDRRGMAHINIHDGRRGVARYAPTLEIIENPEYKKLIGPDAGSLGTIVRSFKAAVTKHVNALRNSPGANIWQRNYYERIVRSQEETIRIRRYIMDNPAHWMRDENHPSCP